MTTFMGAMVRVEKHWRELLGRTELVVKGLHLQPGDDTVINVTRLKSTRELHRYIFY